MQNRKICLKILFELAGFYPSPTHRKCFVTQPLGGRAPSESASVLGNGIYVGMTEWVYSCSGAATLQTSTVLQYVCYQCYHVLTFKNKQKNNNKKTNIHLVDLNTAIRNCNVNGCQLGNFAKY